MNTEQILHVVLIGFWAPIGLLGFAYAVYQIYIRASEHRYDRYQMRRAEEFSDEIVHRIRELDSGVRRMWDEISGRSTLEQKFIETAVEQLQTASERTQYEIQSALKHFSQSLEPQSKIVSLSGAPSISGSGDAITKQGLVRELSHALYTPLSRIDVIATNVLASDTDHFIKEKMVKAKAAVEICYAYLAAYRNVINISSKGASWSPTSLDEALRASTDVFIDASGKALSLTLDAPEMVRPVSNIYMLAVLLPLIENAVDASQEGDNIEVIVKDEPNRVTATVTNFLHAEFPGAVILDLGFSTKRADEKLSSGEQHDGLGLTIVQNLLSATAGANLNYELHDNKITFTVELPSRG